MTTWDYQKKSQGPSATYSLLIDDATHFLLIDDSHMLLLQDETPGTTWEYQQKSS